ncbi:DUF554 domain-containing protein [Pectinatus haikarae]|uniref:DUF554 domain-containing protein n=1 Tax=Pectinatus haikarae TaxID=349096 RepID=UPI0027D871BB|nr:DUF554 domain-containing protein [Pectinatus haikarae]
MVNTAAIIGGGLIGLTIRKGLTENMQETLMKALGIATLFIGLSGAMCKLLIIDDGRLQTAGLMLLVFSLIIGTIGGELINIEHALVSAGEKVRVLLNVKQNKNFTETFVTVTIVVCVGAMAIIGSFEDGIHNDSTILFTKSILDGVIVMIFASTMGIGAIFSAAPLFIYQAGLSLAAAAIAPYLDDNMVDGLSAVGSVLIFVVGINLIFGKNMHIRVGNMLPAVVVPIIYYALF